MKVVKYPREFNKELKTNMVLGAFDAIHNGHEKLIAEAGKGGVPVTVLIVEDVLKLPKGKKTYFESLDIRLQKLGMLGASRVVVLPFTEEIRVMDGFDFIERLSKLYSVDKFFVGHDYRFGIGAIHNAQTLQTKYPKTQIIDIQKVNNKKISSQIVKEQVEFSDFKFLKELIPLEWMTEHRVGENNTITLNPKQISPEPGVYFVKIVYEGYAHQALLHINMKYEGVFKMLEDNTNIHNKPVQIWWTDTIRRIIKKETDFILDGDEAYAKSQLKQGVYQ